MELIDVIEQIPPKIDRFINDWPTTARKWETELASANYTGIVAIGSGTSFNAVKVVENLIRKELSINFTTLKPAEFLLNPQYYFREKTIFLFVSQGGGSKLVYDCLELVKANGYPTVALSEDGNSPIGTMSDYWIDMRSEFEPFLFRTTGYNLTTIQTVFFALVLSGRGKALEEKWLKDLQVTNNHLPALVETSRTWFLQHLEEIKPATTIFFIGAAALKSVADEAAIKFMEMLPVMTQSLDLEESIHGPQNAFTNDMVFFLLACRHEDAIKTRKLSDFIRNEVHGQAYIISNQADINDFLLGESDNPFSYLEFITAFQVGAYLLAKEKGRDLSKVVYPNLTNYIQKKFE